MRYANGEQCLAIGKTGDSCDGKYDFVYFVSFLKLGIWAYSILANVPVNSSSGWIGLDWTGGLGCLLYGSLLSVLHIKLRVGI